MSYKLKEVEIMEFRNYYQEAYHALQRIVFAAYTVAAMAAMFVLFA